VDEARDHSHTLRQQVMKEEATARRLECSFQSHREVANRLQEDFVTAQVKLDWTEAQRSLLEEEEQKLRERCEQGSVVSQAAEAMGSLFGLGGSAPEQSVIDCGPGTALSPELDAQHHRAVKYATKLEDEVSELQRHADQLQREQGDFCHQREELQMKRNTLAEKLARERRQSEEYQQRRDAALVAIKQEQDRLLRLRREVEDVKLQRRSNPTDAIEQMGDMLLNTLRNAPPGRRASVKKKLLLSFHPDKNPAHELATRITQILNRSP